MCITTISIATPKKAHVSLKWFAMEDFSRLNRERRKERRALDSLVGGDWNGEFMVVIMEN